MSHPAWAAGDLGIRVTRDGIVKAGVDRRRGVYTTDSVVKAVWYMEVYVAGERSNEKNRYSIVGHP